MVNGATARVRTNGIDDASLQQCIQRAEYILRYEGLSPLALAPRRTERYLEPTLWSDHTVQVNAEMRGQLQRKFANPAIAANLMSAGYLEISAIGNGVVNNQGLFAYVPQTRAEYSLTVRNTKGTGAGWAGQEHLDWRKIDADSLSEIALDKCQRSAEPVAIEPGRYSVILEPQAVAALMYHLVESLQRAPAEAGRGPWADRITPPDPIVGGRARFGERVLDSRITIQTDPLDPDAPFLPFGDSEEPTRAVTWIKDGVLTNLSYPRIYALTRLNNEEPMLNTFAFRMAGGDTSVEEMVRNTARGVLVTRFVDVQKVGSLACRDIVFCTGRTSDGLWLIERGKITKSIKNFRFREEVVSVFNNVVAMGPATRVLMKNPTIVPPVMVRDFNLTSLSDGV